MAPSRGVFAILRFVRCLLYVLGAVQGLGARLYKPTFQIRRLKVMVLCHHRKEVGTWTLGTGAGDGGIEICS